LALKYRNSDHGLWQYVPELLIKAYRNARREAAAETGLELVNFPGVYSYGIERILDAEFLCDTTEDFSKAMSK
jgi:hypothetical protein